MFFGHVGFFFDSMNKNKFFFLERKGIFQIPRSLQIIYTIIQYVTHWFLVINNRKKC